MVEVYGFRAYDVLCQHYPPKVVAAALNRDIDKGWLECGVSELRPWVDTDGFNLITELKEG